MKLIYTLSHKVEHYLLIIEENLETLGKRLF